MATPASCNWRKMPKSRAASCSVSDDVGSSNHAGLGHYLDLLVDEANTAVETVAAVAHAQRRAVGFTGPAAPSGNERGDPN